MKSGLDSESTGLRGFWLALMVMFGCLVLLAIAFLYQRVMDQAALDLERGAQSYQRLIFNEVADLDRFASQAARALLVNETLSAEQASALFRHRRATNPFVQDLAVLDGDGQILAVAWEGETPQVHERDYFTHHRDHPDSLLYVSGPQSSLVYPDDWFISVSRALRSPDGELIGVAVGMFSIDSLATTLGALLLEDEFSIAVLTETGRLILRLPLAARFAIGDDLSTVTGVELPVTGPTTIRLRAGLDDMARLVHFLPMPEYGLIVAASTTRRAVLSTWWLAVALAATIWLVFSLASLFLLYRLRNSIREMHSSQARFRKVVESASDMIVLVDANGLIQFVSPNWAEMLGHEPESVLGRASLEMIHPEDQPRMGEILHVLVQEGNSQRDVQYRVRHAEGHWRWHSASISALYDDRGKLDAVIGIVRDITDSLRDREQLAQMALEDPLTGLANRVRLSSLLQQAISEADPDSTLFAVLFLDLDGFKPVNDNHGHETGDRLLVQVARRIVSALRRPDVAARFGGDEFVILLQELSDPQEAMAIAERIARKVSQSFRIEDLEITISCSIGVALFPADGTEQRELILNADQAMYRAKKAGRASIRRHE